MGFKRVHSESRVYFISAAHVSLNEEREHLLMDEQVRSYFQHQLNCYATFCGVDLISYSILPDHFYLLVQVCEPESLTDDQLIDRLKAIYKPDRVDLERTLLSDAREDEDDELAEKLRQKFLRRMWDISTFMKELQLHISKWYNRTYDRRGKFWESQFRSSVVRDECYEIGVIASFIELASVREKLVKHPSKYRFASFGAALKGDELARYGIRRVLDFWSVSWNKLANRFLHWLYLHCGRESKGAGSDIKRYAHNIKVGLFSKRECRDELDLYNEVQRGDADHPVLCSILQFTAERMVDYQNSTRIRYALSPKPYEDKVSVGVLKMKFTDFQERMKSRNA